MSTPNFPPNPKMNEPYLHTSVSWVDGKPHSVQNHWKWTGKWVLVKSVKGVDAQKIPSRNPTGRQHGRNHHNR